MACSKWLLSSILVLIFAPTLYLSAALNETSSVATYVTISNLSSNDTLYSVDGTVIKNSDILKLKLSDQDPKPFFALLSHVDLDRDLGSNDMNIKIMLALPVSKTILTFGCCPSVSIFWN